MQHTENTTSDTAARITHATGSAAAWRVAEVQAQPGFCLKVSFIDGTTGMVELRGFLASATAEGTVFEPLRDESFFRRVSVERGAVHWPNGADLAPDAMYDAIKTAGRWTVDAKLTAER